MSVVSADAATEVSGFLGGVTKVVEAVLNGLRPIASLFFGSENVGGVGGADSTSFVLANIAIFIIVFVLVYIVLDSIAFFSEHSWSIKLLSVVVSILAVRFLSNGMINAIIYPYKALGIILAAGIPFLLIFTFIEFKIKPHSNFARKVSWIFAAVVFASLYVIRAWLDVPQVPLYDNGVQYGVAAGVAPELSSYLWIYPVTALLCLLMIALDGTIQKIRMGWEMDKVGKTTRQDAIDEYKKRIADLPALLAAGAITPREMRDRKKEYQDKINTLLKL